MLGAHGVCVPGIGEGDGEGESFHISLSLITLLGLRLGSGRTCVLACSLVGWTFPRDRG